MKRIFYLLILLIVAINTYAYDFQSGDFYYNITSSSAPYTAEVTYQHYQSISNYSGLTTANIPKNVTYNGITYSVTSIGEDAFRGCSSLTSVTIPNSVTSIGNSAFEYCSSLTSMFVEEGNTIYDSRDNSNAIIETATNTLITGCSNTTIPNSVTSIGDYAFSGCSSLTSITIPNSVTSIGSGAFHYCSSLTSITIPESVTSIGHRAFYYCTSLTSVTIPNSVTSIGSSVFYKCSSLTSVTIPNSVTSIRDDAFYNCSSLTSITIPNSVTSIGSSAFNGCRSLTSFAIPNSVTSIGHRAFYYCTSLTSITIPNSVTIIANDAFAYCSSLTSVTIPNSVTSIGSSAFRDCSSLTSITIPNSVMSIGSSAFRDCSSLTSVTIPNSVANIGDEAFRDCFSLTSVTIPNSVTSIRADAFYNCSSLTSITIPNSVTSIGNGAFEMCTSLTSIVIPNSVTSIGWNAFRGCSSLTSITIPNSVTSIGGSAFSGCSSLTSIVIPNSVTSIGESAFYDCSSLTSVIIPESVTSIGYSAFKGCSSLTSPVYNAHCFAYMPTSYSGAYTIPEGIKQIVGSAFDGCSSLTSVTIPNSVTSIESSAFSGCSSLTSITCEAETPPTIGRTYTFDGVSKSIPVYVPCGCVEAYKAANGWEDFTNIQEPLAEYSIEVYVNDTIMGTAKVDYNTFCEGNQISVTPNFGYHFVQWSDGNTDAIRTLELTQDTILTAEFAQSFSGQCGDSLYWELVDTTLHITGKGEMYDYKSDSAPWKLLVSSIKVLTIAEDVTKLSQSFDSCSVLESIVWNAKHAADAYSDGQYVYPIFYGIRSQIKSFTCGKNVEYIPTYLCAGMDKLTSMIIPNSVTSIGGAAFYECSSLTSVTIPNSVTSIGKYAFYGCSSLTSITIPNSVTSIGDEAFSGCNNITSITWNAKNCNTYNFGSQVTSFEFGNEVEVVPSSLCKGMEKLTSVTIPNSVKTIGASAFDGCARLGKISLGTGLEEIAANAFAGCTRLYDIYTYATYPPFAEESSFANYNAYLYIPCDSKRDYTLDPVWGKFKFIECIDSEDATTDGDVTVVPGFNDVTITWPTAENADTYSLVINKDNQPFCTLTFNQEGQLLNIAFAPSRDGNNSPAQYAEQAVNGYRFTVTGLSEATQYAYNITTKDAANKTIATYSGEFTTMGGTTTAVEDILQNTTNVQKLLRNGQLIIVRDGVEYTVMGQEIGN